MTLQSVKDVIKFGDHLYEGRGSLLSFWQEVMDNFAPASADFTTTQVLGTDYASHLATSYPPLVGRDLIDHFGAMLRPNGVAYAEMYVEGLKDYEGLSWLQWAGGVQHRAKTHRPAMFDATMKEADRDFALLGNAAMSIDAMPDKSGLLYQGWHLRDMAWSDDLGGRLECVNRRWTPTLSTLVQLFGAEKLSPDLARIWAQGNEPYRRVNCRHIIIPTSMYHGETPYKTKYVSIHCEEESFHELECVGARSMPYVIPRWRRIKGVPYAISPAAEVALPEARLLQAMVLTLLEAGEKAVNPPLLAMENVIRSDLNTRAGGVIWRAKDHDERQGHPLQPILSDKSGIPLGLELNQKSEMMLRMAFYLDKLELPVRSGTEMTAYEFSKRVEQYIRQVSHLFEPVETEYTGGVEERTFEVLMDHGAFGPPESLPRSLSEAQVQFRFRNPIREAAEQGKGEILREGIELASAAATIDPSAPLVIDIKPALRDALIGKRMPMTWLRSPEAVDAAEKAEDEAQQQEQMLAQAQSASQTAANLAKAQV